MGNRSFFNALHDREGDFLLATVLEGPAQGERVLLRNTAPVWPEKLPAFWGEHLPALAAVTSSGILKSAGQRIFVERFGAAPQLVVCGGGHVGASVVRLAKLLGLPVTALEDRPEFAEDEWSCYEGSYVEVGGKRISDVKQIMPCIIETLEEAERVEKLAQERVEEICRSEKEIEEKELLVSE